MRVNHLVGDMILERCAGTQTKPLAVGMPDLKNRQIKFTICSKALVFAVEVLFHVLGGREVKRQNSCWLLCDKAACNIAAGMQNPSAGTPRSTAVLRAANFNLRSMCQIPKFSAFVVYQSPSKRHLSIWLCDGELCGLQCSIYPHHDGFSCAQF